MSQGISLRATQWAYDQEGLSATAKAVLMTFAIHANDRGYTWPGVDHIASRWGMDRKTVRRQIEVLLVRRLICRTKKRVGATGQVKVYRLPKGTYESGGKSTRFENNQSGDKAGRKSPISGGGFPPNNDNDRTKNKNHDELMILGTSVPISPAKRTPDLSSFFSEGDQNQKQPDQPVQSHIKWPEFAAWCRSKRGQPTEAGFWKWLRGQKPQWRNKVRKDYEEQGYVLDEKFFTDDEANQLGRANPELITKFRKAIKCEGKIKIIPTTP
jgi:hypothetical protein